MEFYATCPTGFERLLANELLSMDTPRVRPLQGQVAFEGPASCAFRVCLRSHLASRVVAVVARHSAADADELFDGVRGVEWERHIPEGATFAVFASGTNEKLRNSQFVALRTKDALVDHMMSATGRRPVVDARRPDVRVVARLSKTRVTLGIDLVGDPLFMRGYQHAGATQGLRPDYAAALLALGGWQATCQEDAALLVDASPTPSTIAIEAGLLCARKAPGLLRVRWGLRRWGLFDERAWDNEVEAARSQERTGADARLLVTCEATGRVSRLRSALHACGLDMGIRSLSRASADGRPTGGMVACDLSHATDADLAQEAATLAAVQRLADNMDAARVAMASRDGLAKAFLGREPQQSVRTRLGQQDLMLDSFNMAGEQAALARVGLTPDTELPVLVPTSDQFAARLKKAARLRAKWARREDVSCYRVYDTDLPDYAVSIDLYQGTDPATGMPDGRRWLLVSEYAAPKGIDPTLAQSRLVDVLTIAPVVLDVNPRDVYLRVRRKARGGSQYAQEAKGASTRRDGPGRKGAPAPVAPGGHLIDEGGLAFEVNFSSYLDCGIFLDHRTTRAMLREMAKQTKGSKRFLNLFAYTGTATCYAADGGARHTTTVDLSRTYLDWARRNMAHNGFVGREHEYVQADVVRWVNEQRHTKNRWDLIFCDVPTFSNSSRMGRRSFDVQRDHAELIIDLSRLLTRDGTCVFSCNLRTFKPDLQTLERAGVELEDITDKTIPEDFSRNRRIHHAFLVRRSRQG